MNTLAQNIDTLQQHQEGEHKMNKDELDRYVQQLINRYAMHGEDGYRLHVENLPPEEKLIFISRICTPSEYAFHMCGSARKQAAMDYYKPEMQKLVDENMPVVWARIQDEIDEWKHQQAFPDLYPSRRMWAGSASCDADDYYSQLYCQY